LTSGSQRTQRAASHWQDHHGHGTFHFTSNYRCQPWRFFFCHPGVAVACSSRSINVRTYAGREAVSAVGGSSLYVWINYYLNVLS
jgi:hypothetical protein